MERLQLQLAVPQVCRPVGERFGEGADGNQQEPRPAVESDISAACMEAVQAGGGVGPRLICATRL